MTLVAGAATSFDLAASLPPGFAAGGTFYADESGAPLPDGVSLTPSGILTVAADAPAGLTAGVIFAYAAP
jgi:hypothetical protein